MGLLDRIFPRRQNGVVSNYFRLLNGYTPVFRSFGGGIYESELVRAAIDAKARHISKLRVEPRGTAKPKLSTQLRKAPNDWQTWTQFLYQVSTILEVKNTAFIVPILDRFGEIAGIYPICPNRWELVTVGENKEPWLRFHFSGEQVAAMELSRVGILTKFQYKSEFFGETNEALKETMELLHIQRQGIEESAKNAASYRFMAKVTNFTKADDLAKERQRFDDENFQRDGGGLLLFPNTYTDIKELSARNYTVDPEQLNIIKTNVYDYFGVNEKVIQNSAKGDELDAFFNGAIEPFSIQLSEVLTKMIYTKTEQGNGNRIMVTANRLQYMTTSEKVALARDLGDRGFILIDEVRELFNFEPFADGAGQVAPIRGEYYMVQEGDNSNGNQTE